MPPVKKYMKAKQKNGTNLCAEEVFEETWEWLKKKVGLTELVNTQLINQYAMSVARQIQCEQCISEYGFLAKLSDHGKCNRKSLCVDASAVHKAGEQSWYQIYQIVRENSSIEYAGATPQDDVMERLLRARKGGH